MKRILSFDSVVLCCFLFPIVYCAVGTNSSNINCNPFDEGPITFVMRGESQSLPLYMNSVSELVYRIPLQSSLSPYPTIIFEPGFFASCNDYDDIQDLFASHGFLVVGINNSARFNLFPTTLAPYTAALLQTVRFIVYSNTDKKSTLFGLVDTGAIGICGHSMGGGGAIKACDSITHNYNSYIKAAVAMNPFGKCDGRNIGVPILLFSSENDRAINPFMRGVSSSPEDVYYSYKSIPQSTTKMFVVFKGMGHVAITDKSLIRNNSGKASYLSPTVISWFKVYLYGDTFFKAYLDTTESDFAPLKNRFISKNRVPAYIYIK